MQTGHRAVVVVVVEVAVVVVAVVFVLVGVLVEGVVESELVLVVEGVGVEERG